MNEKLSIVMMGNKNGLGCKHSPEAIERSRIATIKRWQDPEYRKARSGENHHMKDPETAKKVSEALIGRTLSDEHKKNLSKAHLGYKPTEETRKKMSLAKSGENHPQWGKIGELSALYNISRSDEVRKKISEANSGKVRSEEVIKQMSLVMKGRFLGENHPNWQGGISFFPYPPEFNNTLKERIRERDNHTCQLCGVPQAECVRKLDVHHIDYDKENLADENLISLCRDCNCKVNYNREYWQDYFQGVVQVC